MYSIGNHHIYTHVILPRRHNYTHLHGRFRGFQYDRPGSIPRAPNGPKQVLFMYLKPQGSYSAYTWSLICRMVIGFLIAGILHILGVSGVGFRPPQASLSQTAPKELSPDLSFPAFGFTPFFRNSNAPEYPP